jgi:hypothetical protein
LCKQLTFAQKWNDMTIRRFTVLAILLAVCVTSYMVWRGNEDNREFPEKLEEAIRLCRLRT